MLEAILEWDRNLLVALNSYHAPWLDPIMFYASKTVVWLPLFLFLLYLVVRWHGKGWWLPLSGVAFSILLTDRITSGFMKPFFQRLRPSQEPVLDGVLHLVDGYKGGMYGFASSHAANTFGVAMLFWLLWKDKTRASAWLFLWAGFMTYTRIYLGVHYPGDVLVGAAVGLACGWVAYHFVKRLNKGNEPQLA